MIPSLACPLWQPDQAADAAQDSRSYTTHWGTISLFKFLLENVVANSEFNEEGYLSSNPDIKEGIRKRNVPGPHWHYAGFGYYEGRPGAMPEVDEAWYRRTYPDVADAIRNGKIQSATDHFEVAGAKELRAPRPDLVPAVEKWKAALGKL